MNDINLEDAAVKWLYNIVSGDESYSLDKIKDVVQRFLNAIHVPKSKGCLPLHNACRNGCTNEIILFLIKSWP